MNIIGKSKDHLDCVHESYGQHMGFALKVGFTLIWAGCAAIIHAIAPALFPATASTIIFRLADGIRARMNIPQ